MCASRDPISSFCGHVGLDHRGTLPLAVKGIPPATFSSWSPPPLSQRFVPRFVRELFLTLEVLLFMIMLALLQPVVLAQVANSTGTGTEFTEEELIHLRTDTDAARISFGLNRDVYLVRKEEGELELGGQLRLSGGLEPQRGDHVVSKSYMDHALAQLREEMLQETERLLPVGTILSYAGSNAPSGYLLCDGQEIPSEYNELRNLLGGGEKVYTPNLQGRFLRGAGSGVNPSPRTVLSTEADAFKSHYHQNPTFYVEDGSTTSNGEIFGLGYGGTRGSWFRHTRYTGDTETRPKNTAVTFIIKT